MTGVSYHELTAGATKDEAFQAGQRKQFLVLCVLGAAVCSNAFINAGLFESVKIENDGIYPGGEYVYKVLEDRDYATTGGIWRRISKDLQPDENIKLNLNNNEEKYDDLLYSIYVDDLTKGYGRYFNGILIDRSKKELKKRLLSKNDNIDNLIKKNEDDAKHNFLKLKYQVGSLPSVRSAVATFPFTDGFVSALLHNYKVFPALYKYAKENHDPKSKIVISTSCNRELKLCKHYIPMIKSKAFLLGHPDTEEYMKTKLVEEEFDLMKGFKAVKKLIGL